MYVQDNRTATIPRTHEHATHKVSREKGDVEANYPGWSATIDGEEAAIYPADVAFRDAFVPAQHRVEFLYDPGSFRIGLTIALLGFLALAELTMGLGSVYWVRRVRPGHS